MKIPVLCLLLCVQFGCASVASDRVGAYDRTRRPTVEEFPSQPVPGLESSGQSGGLRSATAKGHRELADLFVRSGLVLEAISEYRHAIELDPHDAAQYFKLGLAYQSQQQFEEALDSYGEAVRLEPESVWAHAALAIVYAKVGDSEAALASYRDVRALDHETAKGLLPVILRYGQLDEV